jgi:hypothetical protein
LFREDGRRVIAFVHWINRYVVLIKGLIDVGTRICPGDFPQYLTITPIPHSIRKRENPRGGRSIYPLSELWPAI